MDLGELSELNTYDMGLIQAQAYRALSNYMTDCLKDFDLTMIEWGALGRICDNSGLKVSEIARQLSVEVPRVIFLIKRLERKGYVARQVEPTDRRVVIIVATPTGLSKKIEVEHSVKDRMWQFMFGVKPKDLVTYLNVMRFIAAKLYR
jgi:DNA-binding MarR family transcriptional regulator